VPPPTYASRADRGRTSLYAGRIVPPWLAVRHAPGVGWLYVLDPDVGDDWHIVRDLGLMPPKGRALCGQLPPSLESEQKRGRGYR
jgi:hypothetical protein